MGIEEEMSPKEERKGSEIQKREVDRGRGRRRGGDVEKDKREVERGRRGTGESGQRGTSIMGCRMCTLDLQVATWNLLKEWNKEKEKGAQDMQWMLASWGPMRMRNTDVSQTVSDSLMKKQFCWMRKHKAIEFTFFFPLSNA